jgi:phospholipid-binding lipoprotein MlaA
MPETQLNQGGPRPDTGSKAGLQRGLLAGCALALALGWAVYPALSYSAGSDDPPPPAEGDPWQGLNRKSYALGQGLDHAVVGPVARAYRKITPAPARRGLGNAVRNLREPNTVLNALFQGRPKVALKATVRFLANSTVGVLGLFDVAGKAGLAAEPADLGQTLGRFGVKPGPYIYVPVIGPTNLRDGLGSLLTLGLDPVSQVSGGPATDFARGRSFARGLDTRSEAEEALVAIEAEATDPYATVRSAYLQVREAAIRAATGAEEALPEFDDPAPEPETGGGGSEVDPAGTPNALLY